MGKEKLLMGTILVLSPDKTNAIFTFVTASLVLHYSIHPPQSLKNQRSRSIAN